MSTKKRRKSKHRRSAAQRAATKRMLAANRRGKRSRRRGRGRARARSIITTDSHVVRKSNPRRRRGHRRGHRRSRARRNPGAGSGVAVRGFFHEVMQLPHNVMELTKSKKDLVPKLFGTAVGAVGSIFAGTIAARTIIPRVVSMLPKLAASPMGMRLLSANIYAATAWVAAKYSPGIENHTRKSILTGGLAAALIEAIRPGTVQKLASKVVGHDIAETAVGGIHGELGDLIMAGLAELPAEQRQQIEDLVLSPGEARQVSDYTVAGLDGHHGEDEYQEMGCPSQLITA